MTSEELHHEIPGRVGHEGAGAMNRQPATCTTPRSGMTLLELPFILAVLVVGFLGAGWLAQRIGWPGYPLGFVGGVLLIPGLMLGIGSLILLIWPDRPRCRNRKCAYYDFERDSSDPEHVWRCNCGIRYRKVGRRFQELPAKGESD